MGFWTLAIPIQEGRINFFQLLFNDVIVIDMKEGSATLLPFKFDILIPPELRY